MDLNVNELRGDRHKMGRPRGVKNRPKEEIQKEREEKQKKREKREQKKIGRRPVKGGTKFTISIPVEYEVWYKMSLLSLKLGLTLIATTDLVLSQGLKQLKVTIEEGDEIWE